MQSVKLTFITVSTEKL